MVLYSSKSTLSRVLVFLVLSYTIALLLDVITASICTSTPPSELLLLWGLARMWSVTLSAVLCMKIFKERAMLRIKDLLKISKRVVIQYLLAPMIVYSALGIYVVIAMPLGLFDFNIYINILADVIRSQAPYLPETQLATIAIIAAYTQFLSSYVVAISINAFFALGEEIGWRGYLYSLLGLKPSFRNVVTIGAIWGLWHASSIVLLGYNYQVNRLLGVALFTLLAIAITFPHLLLVTKSGSIIPASSLHGAFNALWGLTVVATNLLLEQREVFLGLGLLGITTWIIVSITLYFVTRKVSNRSCQN